MKQLVYYIFLIIGALSITSCVDLEQKPKSFITEDQYINTPKNVESVAKGVDGLYHDLWGGNYGLCTRLMRLNVQADDIAPSPTKPNNSLTLIADYSPSLSANDADMSTLWSIFSKVITNSNKIIKGTKIPELITITPNMTSGEKKQAEANNQKAKSLKSIVGEAYFMNALSYFYMVRIFGEVPMLLPETEPTVDMPRIAVKDIYEKVIVPNFKRAAEWLPETSRSGSSNTPDKWVAKTALADVYMTMAGWPLKLGNSKMQEAATLLKEVIDSGKHSLLGEYSDLWKEANVTDYNEFMFTIRNSAADKNPSQYGKSFYPPNFYPRSGWADYFGSADFYRKYPEDKRKDFNYMTSWEVKDGKDSKKVTFEETQEKLPCIAKYQNYDNGLPAQSAQSNGLTPLYRYAEVLLMYAEASTQASGSVSSLALDCLNKVRLRAGGTASKTMDKSGFLNEVFDEYGWEFFAEFKRWFQLVRLEKVKEVAPDRYKNSTYQANNHYYLPVPREQIQLTGWTNNPGF